MELRRAFNQLLLLLLPTDIVHYYLYCNQTLTNPFQQVGNCSQEVKYINSPAPVSSQHYRT